MNQLVPARVIVHRLTKQQQLVLQTYLLTSISFYLIFTLKRKSESFIAMKFIFIILGATGSVNMFFQMILYILGSLDNLQRYFH
ncbi:hypothetical protein BF28_5766 (plasmid) [Bacillus cereus E33L]|uniref:Uncharacterized protein n=1 Tax=Bacillus cereus (strain ZK / E33L) TaxID=288681 RepID=Q4V257_BACCZ|nr:hypothetical protein pE33L466_0029 [Bacillus cereus E33L]AJI26114.1 hypothetical protein BF28_5766 [Bacillus cereus E33L]